MEEKTRTEKGFMEKLTPDDLESTTGGFSNLENMTGFLNNNSDKSVVTGQNLEAGPAEALPGAEAGSLPKMGGNRTVQAYCHMCDRRTTFTVFSGARGKCNECGYMRLDL